ncbi:MAG TPA: hypothetical protein VIG74_01570 [Alphaproteobacteria bacterium]|jgi:hypothetical protein
MTDDSTIAAPAARWHPGSLDLRFMLFMAGIVAYGIGSSPTPDAIGGAEIFTALCLIVATGGWKIIHALRQQGQPSWARAAQMLLCYGFTVPVIAGIAGGNSMGGILRDLIAFLFLLLPLLVGDLCARRETYRRPLTVVIVIVGLMFSLRVLEPVFRVQTGPVWYIQPPADPFYLANAPTVLFAALLLAGLAGKAVYDRLTVKSISTAAIYVGLSFFPFAAMALITQRASMGVIALAALILLGTAFIRRPLRALTPLALLAVAAWLARDGLAVIGHEAIRKTTEVGINMRWAEASAVIREISASLPAVIFGHGWGATVASPAVGGVTVNFTHCLLTTYWLKTGLIGLFLALLYLFHIGALLLRMLKENPIMAVALGGPLAIDILLYASFKSLDFGLVLLLVPLWAAGAARVASPSRDL